jgi:hypothetical protein
LFPLVVIILLAVAGVGGAGHFGVGPLAPLLHKEKVAEPPPPPPKHRVFGFGEIITPIIHDHAIQRQIAIDLDVDINGDFIDKAATLEPRLANDIRTDFYDFLPRHGDVHSSADREAVHDRIKTVA